MENPYELNLPSKLLYDDSSHLLGIGSIEYGQWQPFYDLYETNDDIYAVIKKEDLKIKVIDKFVSIEGSRVNIKDQFESVVSYRSKIPAGQFKLDITLNCEKVHQDAKLTIDNGLYKIQCPKKKISYKNINMVLNLVYQNK
ncbi:hypothetical protein I4U23_010711 [Adineta vaga]|nr:hypothetical protein I4U23_010711 [Adineta vaga]